MSTNSIFISGEIIKKKSSGYSPLARAMRLVGKPKGKHLIFYFMAKWQSLNFNNKRFGQMSAEIMRSAG